jgi:hypothetical protein
VIEDCNKGITNPNCVLSGITAQYIIRYINLYVTIIYVFMHCEIFQHVLRVPYFLCDMDNKMQALIEILHYFSVVTDRLIQILIQILVVLCAYIKTGRVSTVYC